MALLENETIALRALEPEDLDWLYRWENDADLWQHGSTLTPYSRFTLREYLTNALTQDIFESRQLRLMIVEKASRRTVGALDLYRFEPLHLRAGVGIFIDSDYRRKGVAGQALQLMQEYASRILLLKQLYAYVPAGNQPSYRLFQRSGYREAGLLKSWIKTGEGFTDVYLMQWVNNDNE
ncbi:MAG: GNAT family N-acetyltransferase [Dysgonamonadaceae bacterium]|jgi:diamine N-acetyltransferase|nr:GNAT family N-acetyltransferase [Dysgonamonadaceae bacterium]